MIAVTFVSSVSGGILILLVAGAIVGGWKMMTSQNNKLDRMTNYLFQAKTGKDGIPAPVGKIADLETHLEKVDLRLNRLDEGQLLILKRLEMSNGITVAEAVEAMTTSNPDTRSTPPIDISGGME